MSIGEDFGTPIGVTITGSLLIKVSVIGTSISILEFGI